jgi:hypothetical protein
MKNWIRYKVMKRLQTGDRSLWLKILFEILFPEKKKNLDNPIDLMTSEQIIYWVEGWVIDSNGKRIPNIPKRCKVGRAVHKPGNSVEQSIKNRFNDKRGGLVHTKTRKYWKVSPLASILIDDKLKKSIEYLPEPKWNGTIYGGTELIQLRTKQPIEQIIDNLVDKYNIKENNLPKSPN